MSSYILEATEIQHELTSFLVGNQNHHGGSKGRYDEREYETDEVPDVRKTLEYFTTYPRRPMPAKTVRDRDAKILLNHN